VKSRRRSLQDTLNARFAAFGAREQQAENGEERDKRKEERKEDASEKRFHNATDIIRHEFIRHLAI
jgi:hypothetical protein